MSVAATIEAKLRAAFSPSRLAVANDSARHAHHAAMRHAGAAAATGETHFNVEIEAAAFAGKSMVERHRMVNAVLAEELAGPVHALSIKAAVPAAPADFGYRAG